MTSTGNWLLLLAAVGLGCGGPGGDGDVEGRINTEPTLATSSLSTNVIMMNGLGQDALDADFLNDIILGALASDEPVDDDVRLATNDAIQTVGENEIEVLAYLYSCAMPADAEMRLEINGEEKIFTGGVGLAPEWGTGPCDEECQGWVSACLIARTNRIKKQVSINLVGNHPALSSTPAPGYDLREGSYYGNVFAAAANDFLPGDIHACAGGSGEGRGVPQMQGRFCTEGSKECPILAVADCNPELAAQCDGTATAACRVMASCSEYVDGNPTRCHPPEFIGTSREFPIPPLQCGSTDIPATSYDNVITVFLEPTLECGDGFCDVSEEGSCPADCAGSWATRFGSICHEESAGMALDASDNVAIAGRFYGDFDIGGMSTPGEQDGDLFVARLDPDGNLLWNHGLDTAGTGANLTAIASDAAGNVIVAGWFEETLTLDTGDVLTPTGTDFFVARYTPDGALDWVQAFANTTSVTQPTARLAVAPGGDIALALDFRGTLDLGSESVSSASGLHTDILLLTLSSSGTIEWTTTIDPGPGKAGDRAPTALAISATGTVALAGTFSDGLDLGSGTRLSTSGASDPDAFVAQFSATGAVQWVQQIGSEGYSGELVSSMEFDSQANLAAAGQFDGTVSIGNNTLVSANTPAGTASRDAFVGLFSPTGSPQWVYGFGDSGADVAEAVAWDAATGSFHVAARLAGTATVAGTEIDAGVIADRVLMRVSPDGDVASVAQRESPLDEHFRGLSIATNGDIVLSGEFRGSVELAGRFLSNLGGSTTTERPADLFVTRFSP